MQLPSSRPLLPLLLVLPALPAAALEPPRDLLRPTLQAQVWGTVWDQDVDAQADPGGYGDPELDPGFRITRARLGLTGARAWLDYQVLVGVGAPFDTLEEADSSVQLVDAFVGGTWALGPGRLRLTAGTQKAPYSRDILLSSSEITFQERAVASSWLAPNRQQGALMDYAFDMGLRARVGVFNGGGDLLGDDNPGMMGVGRLEWAKGETYSTHRVGEGNAFGLAVSALYESGVATRTLGTTFDGLARIGRVYAMAELGRNTIQPGDTTVDLPDVFAKTVQLGWLAQMGYWQPLQAGSLEAAVRFSTLDDAQALENNGDVALLHAGLTWWDPVPGFSLGAAFVHRMELGGRSFANDSARLMVQVALPAREPPAPEEDWTGAFVGSWRGQADLDGAILTLWRGTDGGIEGTFTMNRPMGRVEVGKPYPVDSHAIDDTLGALVLKVDPHGDGTDIVWFELTPGATGQLCGYAYEHGRRPEAVAGDGGGAWVCWQAQPSSSGTAFSTPE